MRYIVPSIFLGLALIAQEPPVSNAQPPIPPGGSAKANLNGPMIQDAKNCIQNNLPLLRIDRVQEARIHRAAGTVVTLICQVTEEDGGGIWEFRAYRKPNGRWTFQYASRTGDEDLVR